MGSTKVLIVDPEAKAGNGLPHAMERRSSIDRTRWSGRNVTAVKAPAEQVNLPPEIPTRERSKGQADRANPKRTPTGEIVDRTTLAPLETRRPVQRQRHNTGTTRTAQEQGAHNHRGRRKRTKRRGPSDGPSESAGSNHKDRYLLLLNVRL